MIEYNMDMINFALAMSLFFVVVWFIVWGVEKLTYRFLTKRINERESNDLPDSELPES